MKKQQNIVFLMVIFVLLSASIGILHGRKKGVDPAVIADDVRLVLEQQDALDYLQPYLISGNMQATATALMEFTDSLLIKTLDILLQNKAVVLSDAQKVQLLIALLMLDKKHEKQKIVMDRLLHSFANYPVFIVMVPRALKQIPIMVAWLQKERKEQLRAWVQQSIQAALQQDNVDLLTALYEGGMPFDGIEGSPLLYQVVNENKKPAFATFFIEQLKADIHYSPDGKYTPLIKAVELNNKPMVQVLLTHGADPDYLVDSQIGNARQVAFERGYVPIELILNKE